jgi:hypothetical protein
MKRNAAGSEGSLGPGRKVFFPMSKLTVGPSLRARIEGGYRSYLADYQAEIREIVTRVQTGTQPPRHLLEATLPAASRFAGTCSAARQQYIALGPVATTAFDSPALKGPVSSGGPQVAGKLAAGLVRFQGAAVELYGLVLRDLMLAIDQPGGSATATLEAHLNGHAVAVLSILDEALSSSVQGFAARKQTRNLLAPAALQSIADAIVVTRVRGRFAGDPELGDRFAPPTGGNPTEVGSAGAFVARDPIPVNKELARAFLSDIAVTLPIRRKVQVIDRSWWTMNIVGHQTTLFHGEMGSFFRDIPIYKERTVRDQRVLLQEGNDILAPVAMETIHVWLDVANAQMRQLLLSYPPTMDGYTAQDLQAKNIGPALVKHLREAIGA